MRATTVGVGALAATNATHSTAAPEAATSPVMPERVSTEKATATLQAKFALAGYQLVPSTDELGRQVFIVSRWGMTRQLDTFGDTEAFLRRIWGRPA